MSQKRRFILAQFILFLILLTSICSAQSWTRYGGNSPTIKQAQDIGYYSDFTQSVYNTTILQGITAGYQPLVDFFEVEESFLVIPNGAYIQIYDRNLNLIDEANVGTVLTQIDILDWNKDGTYNIAVLTAKNNTAVSFKILNFVNASLSVNYSVDIDSNISSSWIGIGHYGYQSDFVYLTSEEPNLADTNYTFNLVEISNSSVAKFPILNETGVVNSRKPLASYDVNNDGKIEYLTSWDKGYLVFQEDGTVVSQYLLSYVTDYFLDAKFIKPDGTSQWKIAVLKTYFSGSFHTESLTVFKLDNSTLWNNVVCYAFVSSDRCYGNIALGDFDGDGRDDIYFSGYYTNNNFNFQAVVYKGDTGTTLSTVSNTGSFYTGGTSPTLTIADMNNDGIYDFISNNGNRLFIVNPSTQTYIYNGSSALAGSCIPADLGFNGILDVICSKSSRTTRFYINFTNQNPVITEVTYSPSIAVAVNTPLTALISATDNEGDAVLYNRKCSDFESWGTESYSSSQSCTYNSTGIFNMTVGVRDAYHDYYTIFDQNIIVSQYGITCNNNGSCDAFRGEDWENCPNDCIQPPISNITQVEGGTAIPTRIVDTENTESGLLPEIYYGILGFLSYTLSPMIILIFFIFFVLIIFAIAMIIKKIAHKVGDLG